MIGVFFNSNTVYRHNITFVRKCTIARSFTKNWMDTDPEPSTLTTNTCREGSDSVKYSVQNFDTKWPLRTVVYCPQYSRNTKIVTGLVEDRPSHWQWGIFVDECQVVYSQTTALPWFRPLFFCNWRTSASVVTWWHRPNATTSTSVVTKFLSRWIFYVGRNTIFYYGMFYVCTEICNISKVLSNQRSGLLLCPTKFSSS